MKRVVALVVALALLGVSCSSKTDEPPVPATGQAPAAGGGIVMTPGQLVLIVPILVAVALPTFLGARDRAQDKAAQSSLRNGLAAAKTYYVDDDSYEGFDPAAGAQIEPALQWTKGPSTSPTQVSIAEVTPNSVALLVASETGRSYCLSSNESKPSPQNMEYGVISSTGDAAWSQVRALGCLGDSTGASWETLPD